MPDVRINLPDDGDEFELVAQFAASPFGATIDSQSGGVKMPLQVPVAAKHEALKVTDRPGETLFFVVFGRVQQQHYGAPDESDEPRESDAEDG